MWESLFSFSSRSATFSVCQYRFFTPVFYHVTRPLMHLTQKHIVSSEFPSYDGNHETNHCFFLIFIPIYSLYAAEPLSAYGERVSMIIEAIFLGLSTGTYCTMSCGPVLIPFLCGTEKVSYKRNALLTGTFLLARLVMYFILGGIFAGLGCLVNKYMNPVFARRLSVYAYIVCGTSLLFNSLGVKYPWDKESSCHIKKLRHVGNDWLTVVVAGLAVGLHICPPLWTAMLRSVFGGHGLPGLFYFVFFYVGTLPFFFPLLGIPFITKRIKAIKNSARISQFLISLYFLIIMGLLPLIFGQE